MGDINIVPGSELKISSIDRVGSIAPVTIEKVQSIAPVATHIKEVNHIDPISVESLHVRGVKNVDPIQIEKLNITNFPAMNMSLRQLPPLDMNVRRVPPLSIGLHQHIDIPSDYTVRASFLGIEWVRVRIQGSSSMIPRDRYRREVSRTLNRSSPEVAPGGNPAIPSRRVEKSVVVQCPVPPAHGTGGCRPPTHGGVPARTPVAGSDLPCTAIHVGQPTASFGLSRSPASQLRAVPVVGSVRGG